MEKTELMLDFDDKNFDNQKFYKKLSLLMKFFKFNIIGSTEKKTRHGHHIRLELDKKFQDRDIVFFQLFLGSDYKRELHNYFRVVNNVKRWNVLFQKKYDSKMRIISRER